MKFEKHKKVLAMLAAAAMLASAPAAVFADGSFGENTAQTDRDIAGNAPFTLDAEIYDADGTISDSVLGGDPIKPRGKPVPVYGYVGKDAVITDPDYTDPDKPPVVTQLKESDINVSVPVKILWAAFENGSVSPGSSAGEVISPEYYIRNNSKTTSLKVQVYRFIPTGGVDVDANTEIDKNLKLHLTSAAGSPFELANLVNGNGTNGVYPYAATEGAETSGFVPGAQWRFGITGVYAGLFTANHQPTYNLQLKFDIESA
jgi:hypothetical protein